jgi:hypothetical protein
MLAFERASSDGKEVLTFWFQCSQDGWDRFTGSQFTVEFQIAPEPGPGHGPKRERFFRLLTPDERERVRLLQNRVIEKLEQPPPEHWAHTADPGLKSFYFAGFTPLTEPYSPSQDVWLRYVEEADVRQWADFLLPLLPRLIEDFSKQE